MTKNTRVHYYVKPFDGKQMACSIKHFRVLFNLFKQIKFLYLNKKTSVNTKYNETEHKTHTRGL